VVTISAELEILISSRQHGGSAFGSLFRSLHRSPLRAPNRKDAQPKREFLDSLTFLLNSAKREELPRFCDCAAVARENECSVQELLEELVDVRRPEDRTAGGRGKNRPPQSRNQRAS
jgi:hypothetical protein